MIAPCNWPEQICHLRNIREIRESTVSGLVRPQKKGAGNILPVILVISALNFVNDSQLARQDMSPVEHLRKHGQRTGPRKNGVRIFLTGDARAGAHVQILKPHALAHGGEGAPRGIAFVPEHRPRVRHANFVRGKCPHVLIRGVGTKDHGPGVRVRGEKGPHRDHVIVGGELDDPAQPLPKIPLGIIVEKSPAHVLAAHDCYLHSGAHKVAYCAHDSIRRPGEGFADAALPRAGGLHWGEKFLEFPTGGPHHLDEVLQSDDAHGQAEVDLQAWDLKVGPGKDDGESHLQVQHTTEKMRRGLSVGELACKKRHHGHGDDGEADNLRRGHLENEDRLPHREPERCRSGALFLLQAAVGLSCNPGTSTHGCSCSAEGGRGEVHDDHGNHEARHDEQRQEDNEAREAADERGNGPDAECNLHEEHRRPRGVGAWQRRPHKGTRAFAVMLGVAERGLGEGHVHGHGDAVPHGDRERLEGDDEEQVGQLARVEVAFRPGRTHVVHAGKKSENDREEERDLGHLVVHGRVHQENLALLDGHGGLHTPGHAFFLRCHMVEPRLPSGDRALVLVNRGAPLRILRVGKRGAELDVALAVAVGRVGFKRHLRHFRHLRSHYAITPSKVFCVSINEG